jgi:putative transposase
VILAHKIALDPTYKQAKGITRACGVKRFAWNWALAEWDAQYKAGNKPTANKLKKRWNGLKKAQYPWVYDSPKGANQQPFSDLGEAFDNFFKGKSGRPKFKKKGYRDSFYVENDKFQFTPDGWHVHIPKIGNIRIREQLRFTGKILSGTVSKHGDRFFISVHVDVGEKYSRPRKSNHTTGADLGVKTLATLPKEKIKAPKPLKTHLKRLRRLSKALSRKKKGSNNRFKAKRKLANFHRRITNIRLDTLHKLTTRLCRENQLVTIENLNVKGMLRNHKLARAIADLGFGIFKEQISYKYQIFDSIIVLADMFFPSTKGCDACNHVNKHMTLADRIFICENCGHTEDRDTHAANRLHTLGLRELKEFLNGLDKACGPESSGYHHKMLIPKRMTREMMTKLCWDEAGTKPCSQMNTN